MKRIMSVLGYCALFCSVIGLDRITKYYIRVVDADYTINQFLTFTLQYNRGISWGMFHSKSSLPFILLNSMIILFIALFISYTLFRFIKRYAIFGEIMVCAGACSNMIDRFWYGGVADFILVSYKGWSWPVFNLADVFIVCGLALMLLMEFLYYEH